MPNARRGAHEAVDGDVMIPPDGHGGGFARRTRRASMPIALLATKNEPSCVLRLLNATLSRSAQADRESEDGVKRKPCNSIGVGSTAGADD
jgi:hypothetical protein